MTNRKWYIAWAWLYLFTAALSFIPHPQGLMPAIMVVLSILFYLPPSVLLYRAYVREKWGTVRIVRNLCIASLVLTMVVMVLNILSVGASDAVGTVLYWVLLLVSVPMISLQVPLLSIFAWACIFVVSLRLLMRKNK